MIRHHLKFVHTPRRLYFLSSVRFCLSKSFPCIPTSDDLQGAQHSNFWWSVHLDMSNCLQSTEYPYSMSNLHQVTNCLNCFEYCLFNFLWQHCFNAKKLILESKIKLILCNSLLLTVSIAFPNIFFIFSSICSNKYYKKTSYWLRVFPPSVIKATHSKTSKTSTMSHIPAKSSKHKNHDMWISIRA